MKITEKEVRYVAGLANLNLTEEEIVRMQTDLDGIFWLPQWLLRHWCLRSDQRLYT